MAVNMIMVVDDDEFQLSLMNEQLLALGWTDVLLAASGEAALRQLDQFGPDIAVIISDLSMPGMDGLRVNLSTDKCCLKSTLNYAMLDIPDHTRYKPDYAS